jgi:hypothetical protein
MGLERSGPPRQPFTGIIWRWPDGTFLNSGQASNANPYAHFAIDTMTNLGLWSPHYAYLAQAQGWAYHEVRGCMGRVQLLKPALDQLPALLRSRPCATWSSRWL